MNPQYEILAKCLLPTHMLEWFELTNVEVKPKEKTATQDTESDESPVNVIHLYLDENELIFYIYCHSATNLLLHQYLGKFEVTAEWLQISIFGKKDFQ